MFTPENVWHGGYYELAIELGERSDARLELALRTVELEPWLASIAMGLAPVVDFRLALIGFEVSGMTYAELVAREGISETRYDGYVYPHKGTYRYFARNMDS